MANPNVEALKRVRSEAGEAEPVAGAMSLDDRLQALEERVAKIEAQLGLDKGQVE